MSAFPKPITIYPDVCAVPLSDLLISYNASIELLRKVCHKEIEAHKLVEKADPNFGDDIFLLRFVLSHHKKGVEKTKSYLLKAIEWRAKNAAVLLPLRAELTAPANDEKIRPYMPGGLHFCTLDGHPLFLIRNGIANPHAVIAAVKTSEALSDWMVLTKESAHAYCDAKTRQLGRLIKVVAVQDFKGISMKNFNRHFMNALASSSHVAETVYPQLLRKSIIVHLPMLLRKMTFLTLKLMPQGLQEKVAICPESDITKISQYISDAFNIPIDDLPTYLGGKCLCEPHGCTNNTPNKITHLITDDDIKKLSMASWASYVTDRVGQPPVSRQKGIVWPYAATDHTFKLKGEDRGLYMTTLDKGFTPHPSLTTIPSQKQNNLSAQTPSSSSANDISLSSSCVLNSDAPKIDSEVTPEEAATCDELEAEVAKVTLEENALEAAH